MRGVGDADELTTRSGGVGERAEEVEDSAHRELAPHGDDVARRLVVGWGEHEPEADAVDARADGGGVEIDARAEGFEQVGGARRARGRAVAVLGDRAPGARGDQRGGRGDVEGAHAAAGAGGVEEVLTRARDSGSERAHRAREPRELCDGLALRAQRDQERGDLYFGGVAAHDLREHVGGLLGAQVGARGERIDRVRERLVGHQAPA